MSIKINKRQTERVLARNDLKKCVIKIVNEYDLSFGELFSILAKSIQDWAEYLKSDEDNTKQL